MKKSLVQIYALLVCLITTLVFMISLGLSTNALLGFFAPALKNYSLMSRYESNESYIQFRSNLWNGMDAQLDKEAIAELKKLPQQELDAKRVDAKKEFLKNTQRKGIEDLLSFLQAGILALVFYIFHWRLYKRA